MANEKPIKLTKSGAEKMQEELAELRNVRRPEVIQKIKEARAQGDLSENAEYDAAKEEQGKIESQIALLEATLGSAEVIDPKKLGTKSVSFGSTVRVYDEMFDEEVTYQIVGSLEAAPRENRISDDSPVGAALIGAKVGDQVSFETPGGTATLKVLKISK